MQWGRGAIGLVAVVAAACGNPGGETAIHGESTGGSEAAAPRRSGSGPYADSPLTPFADEMTELARAALRDRDLPRARFPIAGANGRPIVAPDGEPPEDVVPIAFLVRLDVGLGDDAERRWLQVVLTVSGSGMRVLQLEPRSAAGPTRPAADAGDLGAAIDAVLGSLRGGELDALLDRDETLAGAIARVPEIDAEAARAHAGPALPLRRLGLGDVAVLAMRGADLYLLEMRVLTSEHGFRIAADPLVRVLPVPAL